MEFFYLLLLFLPTQIGLHFWPAWSYVIGRKVDYLSPTIYFTDILILLIIVISFKINYFKQLLNFKSILVILFIALNIYFSSIPLLAVYKWLKIFELFLLGVYIIKNINLKKDWQNIVKVLSIGIIFESLLCILQFLNQSSINGMFYWFGERAFTISTAGIAKTTLEGIYLLRPYGTFSHPNALGGYLATLLPLVLVTDFKPMKIKWLAFVLGLSALFLTFSKTAFVIGFIGVVASWLMEKKIQIKYSSMIFITFIMFIIIIGIFSNIPLEKESIERRISLNVTSLEIFQKKPILGVGLGNFIPNLPVYSKDKEVMRFLQPAHNIYLLILSELGVLGLAVFICILSSSLNNIKKNKKNIISIQLLVSTVIILLLGLFDHYFITLQQTQILFTIIVSLALIKYPHEV